LVKIVALVEVGAAITEPAGLALGGAVAGAAGLTHTRRDLVFEVEDVAVEERDKRRDAGEGLEIVDVVEPAPIARRPFVDLMVPADTQVEQQPLVEEAAVELAADVVRRVVGEVVVRVEREAGVARRGERRARLERSRN